MPTDARFYVDLALFVLGGVLLVVGLTDFFRFAAAVSLLEAFGRSYAVIMAGLALILFYLYRRRQAGGEKK